MAGVLGIAIPVGLIALFVWTQFTDRKYPRRRVTTDQRTKQPWDERENTPE